MPLNTQTSILIVTASIAIVFIIYIILSNQSCDNRHTYKKIPSSPPQTLDNIQQSSLPYALRTYFTDIDKINKNNKIDLFEFSNSLDFLSENIVDEELNNILFFILQNGEIDLNMVPNTDPNKPKQPKQTGRWWLQPQRRNVRPGGYCRHGSECKPIPGTTNHVCRDYKCSDGSVNSSCGINKDCQTGKCINYKCSDSVGGWNQPCDWDHPCRFPYGCHFGKCGIIRHGNSFRSWGFMDY